MLQMFAPTPSPRDQERRLFPIRGVYETDHAEPSLWFSSISSLISFNITGYRLFMF